MSDCNCCQDLSDEEYKALGDNPTTAEVIDALRKKRQRQKLIEKWAPILNQPPGERVKAVLLESWEGPGISPLSPPTPELLEMARESK